MKIACGIGQREEVPLGQFLAPDTIVPAAGNALDYHRYAYTRFNPVRFEDGVWGNTTALLWSPGNSTIEIVEARRWLAAK